MTPDEFKGWRKALGLSQEEAAERLGLSRSSVLNYERGSRREDGRIVEIPLTVHLACEAVSIAVAVERNDAGLLTEGALEKFRALDALVRGSQAADMKKARRANA